MDDAEKAWKKERVDLKSKNEENIRELSRYKDLLNLREQEITGMK
jgi:hypothetical protein